MKKKLLNDYAFLGGASKKKSKKPLSIAKGVFGNSFGHILLFAVLICVIGNLANDPNSGVEYTWLPALMTTMAYSISAIGFCLLMGYSGLASLGTGGFIGIGTYAIHYLVIEGNLMFMEAVLVSIAVAVVIGTIVGFISLRIEGIYLVILTLGLSEILRALYGALEDTITLYFRPLIFGVQITRFKALYVVVAVLSIVLLITNNLIKSPTGRAMLAMKNSTAAAQAMGISLMKYRLFAFIICTVYAALSGSMLLLVLNSASAQEGQTYALITSLNILAAVIIGGYKSIWGAIFGCFVMFGMQSAVLSNLKFLSADAINFVAGILVILIVMFFPGGFAQLLTELKYKLKKLFGKVKEAIYGKDLG